MDDVFRITGTQNVGGTLVLSAQITVDACRQRREERFHGTGLTPVLQNDEDGQPRVLVLPIDLDQTQRPNAGGWINVVLFAMKIVTTTWAGALHQGVNLAQAPSHFMLGFCLTHWHRC